jgi:hypothetical protein
VACEKKVSLSGSTVKARGVKGKNLTGAKGKCGRQNDELKKELFNLSYLFIHHSAL